MKAVSDPEVAELEPLDQTMRTSEQIKAEIEKKFGFFPPFFSPAEQNPQVLENLWQQTLSAYVNSPPSALFKEKLSAYLSRYCAVPYCMICHSCCLRPLGMKAQEVLDLLESPPPTENDVGKYLSVLARTPNMLTTWPESNSALEESLLYCSIFISLEHDKAESCRQEMRRILGPNTYAHLIAFVAYIKTCHVWMEAHPEVAYEADKRVQDNLGALVKDEPALADFFLHYSKMVRREHQSRAQQLAELSERKRAEESLRQQIERERLVTEIAQRIRQSLNLDEILSTTVSEVRQFLQVDRVFIYRFEPDWGGVVVVESVGDDWKPILGSRLRDPSFAETYIQPYKQGRIQATADIYVEGLTPCYIDFLAQFQVKADLVVPILQGDELWGLLVANNCSEPRQWQQLEIDLLKQLATQVAIAIQQSELYQQAQTELTDRKRAEKQIREQATLLDKSQDSIFVLDMEDRILFWNKSANSLFGWTAKEAIGTRADALLFKQTSPQLEDAQKIISLKGEWHGELHQVTKDGKKIIVESRWTLVRDEDEKPKSILVVNTDITQKKQLEASFLRAQRMESLGTLAGGIAHDLNNVLTPIIASAQLLLQAKLNDEKRHRLLTTIETSAKRGAALVKQVLSFSRGVEGKRAILQVRHLLAEIRNIAKETFPKAIEFYMVIPQDLWAVFGDTTQLHQVFMNLCVNARDAMPHGGTLSICAENYFIDENYARMNLEAQVGPYIIVTIADTGTGISHEIIDRIFEPFFTTKEQGKGTGLGLSTVTGIVKSHGGFVNVCSQMRQGTQFQVYLPAVEGSETQPTQEYELSQGNGELILVVDDEAAICQVTKTSLETYNYKAVTANDGIEAIALYAQHKNEISVVLMDMMMPEMDGLTTIRMLKKINPQVKIIAISGLAVSDKVNVAMDSGVKDFLPKPYTAQELLQAISGVLSAR